MEGLLNADGKQQESARWGNRKGNWQRYSISDGLPAGSVRPVMEDRRGRLWFGTGRFKDGSGLVLFGIDAGLYILR